MAPVREGAHQIHVHVLRWLINRHRFISDDGIPFAGRYELGYA